MAYETRYLMSVHLSAKQATLRLVERMEDDVTFEDIIYELYVLEKIQRGMKDAEEGRVVSHEEAKQRLNRWLK
jgi:predicted transcriptional regulator